MLKKQCHLLLVSKSKLRALLKLEGNFPASRLKSQKGEKQGWQDFWRATTCKLKVEQLKRLTEKSWFPSTLQLRDFLIPAILERWLTYGRSSKAVVRLIAITH
jgi:hypothetical protein